MTYREAFDTIGQLRQGDHQPWTLPDKIILALFCAVLMGVIFLC